MSITVRNVGTKEVADFRDPSAVLTYFLCYTTDEAVSRAWFNSTSPALYYGLPKRSIDQEYLGGGAWLGTVKYGMDRSGGTHPIAEPGKGGKEKPKTPDPDDPLDETHQFTTRGGLKHISQCKQRIFKVTKDKTTTSLQDQASADVVFDEDLADKDKTIGVDQNGTVHGTEAYDAAFRHTVTFTLQTNSLRYMQTLRDLTATVNDSTFYHYPAGSVLFEGADGEKRGPDTFSGWTVTFGFLVSKNLSLANGDDADLTVTGPAGTTPLVVPAKDGWDHLWVKYRADVVDGKTVEIPDEAYVDRIYDRTDFGRLGIGGTTGVAALPPPPPVP